MADAPPPPPRILIVGVERSGTSWLSGALRSTPGTSFVGEPDHPVLNPFAVRAVEGLGSHPVIARDGPAPDAYRRLWDAAFGAVPNYARGRGRISRSIFRRASRGDRLAVCHPEHPRVTPRLRVAGALAVPKHLAGDTRTRVVKSVCVHFALDWLRENWNPTVVVCRRHPLDIVASALALDMPSELDWLAPAARAEAMNRFGVPEPVTSDPITCMAWRTGLLTSVFDEQVRRHPELHVADHEYLCGAQVERLRELVTSVGLEWSPDTEKFVVDHDRPGTGFQVNRVAAELPGKWRNRLSADDARTAAEVLAQFPISERYDLSV